MKKIYLYLGGLMLCVGLLVGINYTVLADMVITSMTQVTSLITGDENATSSNATNSNATNSNATNSNATDSNLGNDDEIVNSDDNLFITRFEVNGTGIENGSVVPVDIEYTGAELTDGTIYLTNKEDGTQYTAQLGFGFNGDDVAYYMSIPSNVKGGKYELTKLVFYAKNSDGSTFSKTYEGEKFYEGGFTAFTVSIDILNLGEFVINFSNISFSTDGNNYGPSVDVENNKKVYVNYVVDKRIEGARLTFTPVLDHGTAAFSVSLYDIDTKPYFIVPSDWSFTKFYLTNIEAWDNNGNGVVRVPPLDIFVNVIEPVENPKDDENDNNSTDDKREELNYNNENINEGVLKDIYESEKDSIITIDASRDKTISEDLFNVIKGTSRDLVINVDGNQIIFNGQNITTVKTIDVTMSTNLVSKDEKINKLLNNGFVVNFANNGKLPGKATIKLKATQDMIDSLKNNSLNLYYFQENKNKFNLISENIVLNKDNYYVFSIDHNSKYVLTSEKISSDLVEVADTAAFQKKDSSYVSIVLFILIIALSIVCYVEFAKEKKEYEIEVL